MPEKPLPMEYPELESLIFLRGTRTTVVAKALNISPRTLYNKRLGSASFTLREARIIQDTFFPDKTLDFIFSPAERDNREESNGTA